MQTPRPSTPEAVIDLLVEAGAAFRMGVLNLANERLVQVIDGVSQRMAALQPDTAVKCNELLQTVIQSHQRGDYIGLADTLEYELKNIIEEMVL